MDCVKCNGTGKGERGFYNCVPCSGSGKVPPLQGSWRDVLKALDALGASYGIVANQEIWFEYAGHEAKLTTPAKDAYASWTLTAWDLEEREVRFDKLSGFALWCHDELGDMSTHR